MIAAPGVTWMAATVMVFALLIAAALVLERVAASARGVPLRSIWMGALTAAVVLTLRWIPQPSAPSDTSPSASPRHTAKPSTAQALGAAPRGDAMPPATPTRTWPTVSASLDRWVLWGWLGASGAAACVIVLSLTGLARERRRWRPHTLHGVPVLLAADFGPAIVGLRAPAIVLPEWVLALRPEEQQVIVAHELEHRRARDPWLLAMSVLVVVLMPWNAGAWFIRRRLRRAIELDCDARVVARGVAPAMYAQVLLSAWHRAHPMRVWGLVPALAERASGLGRRVEHLMRPAPRRLMMHVTIGGVLAAALMGATQLVPTPPMMASGGARATTAMMMSTTQPARPGRVLVLASPDTVGQAIGDVYRTAIAADTAGRPVTVIARRDIEGMLQAAGFSNTAVLTDKDVEGIARLLRAELVVRVAVSNRGDDVTIASGTPGARPGDLTLRPLLTISYKSGPASRYLLAPLQQGQSTGFLMEWLQNDATYQRLRHPVGSDDAVLVRLTSVGVELPETPRSTMPFGIRIYSSGDALVGVGTAPPQRLRDTLRLDRLPALTADVTSGDVHLEVDGPGRIKVAGTVRNGPATTVSGTGRHLVLVRGGTGITIQP